MRNNNLIPLFLFFLIVGVATPGMGAVKSPDTSFKKSIQEDAARTEKDSSDGLEYEALTTSKDPKAFSKGYRLYEKKKYRRACPYFYNYLANHSPDDTEYEWAEFFLGVSLKQSGFSHAAVDLLSHLVIRKPNPKIVSYIIEMFEEITRTMPYDKDQVILKVLCDEEYGFIEQRLQNFINYYQGVFNWEHGFLDWGTAHFDSIERGTYYYYKSQYQLALMKVYQNSIDDAIDLLNTIVAGLTTKDETRKIDYPEEFLVTVRKTLARLYYEKKQFSDAHLVYQDIENSKAEQSQNLLEQAWVAYRRGNPQKAMGLLFAFGAPGFQKFFTPEYFILKSFIYKDVCHYQRAMDVVKEFHQRYDNALDSIYKRKDVLSNRNLALVVLNKNKVKQNWDFLNLLEKESAGAVVFQKKEPALYKFLYKIYQLQIEESKHKLRKQVDEEYEKVANELLKYEEEANLMEYEVALDITQRAVQYHFKDQEAKNKKKLKNAVVYPFQGEYWNDELANFKVNLPNKCDCMEEWDIFFK